MESLKKIPRHQHRYMVTDERQIRPVTKLARARRVQSDCCLWSCRALVNRESLEVTTFDHLPPGNKSRRVILAACACMQGL